ncbi:hypothetical protein [Saccharolobus caldissimus]|nr:hypothetical protein [Saccharolobus caldissimus]
MQTMNRIEDPCIQQCFMPSNQWKFIDIEECLSQCKQLKIIKP